jgi:hypothetical protein
VAVAVTYIDSHSTGTDASSHTYASVSIGTASADRLVVVAAIDDPRNISGVTIGGNAAAQLRDAQAGGSGNSADMWGLVVPTGTTATIVVSYSGGNASRGAIGIWTVTGHDPAQLPYDSAAYTGNGTGGTMQLDVVADGAIIAAGYSVSDPAFSWTGITEDFEINVESSANHASGASATTGSTQSNYSVTVNMVGGGQGVASVISFAPLPNVETGVTGVSGSGFVGTLSASGAARSAINGNQATGAAGSLTVRGGASVALTGLAATGAAGTPTAVAEAVVELTGVEATSAVGTLAGAGSALAEISGVEAASAVGVLVAEVDDSTEAIPSGIEAIGSVGDLTATGGAVAALTGVSATGAVGTLAAVGEALATLTGVAATGAVGSPSVTTSAVVALSGVAGTSAVGTLTVGADAIATIAGVQATGQVGSPGVTLGAIAALNGVSATGTAGEVLGRGSAAVALSGVQAAGAAGQVGVSGADGALGLPVGVEATAEAGNILIIIRPASIWTDLFKDRDDLALNDNATGDHTSRNLITKPGISPSQITSDHPSRSGITRSGVSLSKTQQVFR